MTNDAHETAHEIQRDVATRPIQVVDGFVMPETVGARLAVTSDQSGADVVFGHDLITKDMLVGVPFVVTGITVRESDYPIQLGGKQTRPTNMLSVEIVIGPLEEMQRALSRKRITPELFAQFDAGDALVFNDSGTGVYRQLVAYLQHKRFITVPDGSDGGEWGDARWETHRSEWDGVSPDNPDPHFDVLLKCPRGLRASTYQASVGGEATTYYI